MILLTLAAVIAVAYAHLREGLFTAFTVLVNVLLAGLLAFNFWPPIANVLEPEFQGSSLAGYEDALCLVGLFALALGGLRLATMQLANREVRFAPGIDRGGAAACGALTGYLAAGFLTCVFQTLPWQENFWGFSPHTESGISGASPDQLWLSLMVRSHRGGFNPGDDQTKVFYDFEKNYALYRRYTNEREPLPLPGTRPPVVQPPTTTPTTSPAATQKEKK